MNEKPETKIILSIIKEALEIQKQHAYDPTFSKAERQKRLGRAVESIFKQELS